MPTIMAAGVTLSYEATGAGAPVLLLAGSGATGRSWTPYQVPALTRAGLRAYTMDNRGAGGSGPAEPGLSLADLVGDTVAVIERAVGGPCAVIGTSLGAQIAQELTLARPDLVTRVILIASRARPDPMSRALTAANRELAESGVPLPARHRAVTRALQNLSPATLADPQRAQDWLDLFEVAPENLAEPGRRAQLDALIAADRRDAYGSIRTPALVLSFADDLVAPPVRGRELAEAIPGAVFRLIADAGHYGYLEQPEVVNEALVSFLTAAPLGSPDETAARSTAPPAGPAGGRW